jgi:putative membrane protein
VITENFKKKLGSKILLCSATALLAGVTAMAQAPGSPGGGSPGGGQQPNTPSTPTSPGSQTPGSAAPGSDGAAVTTQQFSDQAFVRKALEGGAAEVELGQLAQQKSQSADVKQFGEKMVQDHTQMGEQMKMVAKTIGVSEPKGPSKKDKQLIAKLSALSGDQFDQEYIKAMLKDHKQDLKEFKDQSQMTQDPNLQKLTQVATTVISHHLEMIEQIAQSHNITAQASNK